MIPGEYMKGVNCVLVLEHEHKMKEESEHLQDVLRQMWEGMLTNRDLFNVIDVYERYIDLSFEQVVEQMKSQAASVFRGGSPTTEDMQVLVCLMHRLLQLYLQSDEDGKKRIYERMMQPVENFIK